MAVGGGQGEIGSFDLEEDAGEHRPRLIGGGGHLGLLHGFQHLVEGHLEPVTLVWSRAGRKLLGFDALDVGVEAAAAETQGLGGEVELERQFLVGQGRDEVGEQPGGDGGAALVGDLRRHHLSDSDLEVGGGQGKALVGCLDEDVVEDRQGRSCRDRPGDGLKGLAERTRHAADFQPLLLVPTTSVLNR